MLISCGVESVTFVWVGPSVADDQPKDSQGFEQVRIVFSHFRDSADEWGIDPA